ncbi:Asp-tRNA(Asn)/Glu-tRNA(Gln) amidotransferase GatCAB subunit A [Granulicella tundricola]|uniref:Amidase n=1 Tax=Granulicella tundricola (strain ATCC BAA-1859 / DSM 23138 / MP5ACTX9) TaxID=1198114 RepID=E8X276_GRATM|nr:Asp-tRNA(Asn)/Glu-tRNA(Gln) amidotransferase GatCAB subunit A [Granulicella tundricola]ADW70319.1 Amidase [Granulicella tundricola MP5ACTX9]
MTKLTRRGFNFMCGTALVAETFSAAWPRISMAAMANTPDPDKLTAMTLTEVSGMIHMKTITSTELVKALLDRINLLNPKLNCYITVMGKEALAQAATLDAEQKAGKFRGPLHGIPISLKDNIDTAGTRTTAASPMFKDRVPTEDAEIVRKLKLAGAIILGKLNLHEFALGCTGDISYFGPSRNPWNLAYVTGGSSAGSGAAVSATLAYGALGTDTGGSIRCPSAWCGIVGLKPTIGLVSIRGIIPCSADLDHCGPMARTVEDVALMLTQMAGYDSLDIFSVPSTPADYVKEMTQPVKGFRLGTPQSFYDHVEPEIEKAIKAALEVLTSLTAGVTSSAPLWSELPGGAPGDSEFYHHDLIERYGLNYMLPTRTRFERMENPTPGAKVATAADDARAHQKLLTTRRMIDASFKDFDLVVVPTTRNLAPTINDSLANETKLSKAPASSGSRLEGVNGKVYDWFAPGGGCTNTAPFDAYGIPAISLPCGFTESGMPIGLMIAGPHFTEGKVLALAYAYQQATQWHKKLPFLNASTVVPPIIESGSSEAKIMPEAKPGVDAK